jgi:taurine dioxygenase
MNALDSTSLPWQILRVSAVQPSLGAEVTGIDLRAPLDEHARAGLRGALLRYRVLFFRDQALSRQEFVRFATTFGALESDPISAALLRPFHSIAPSGHGRRCVAAVGWESSASFCERPPAHSLLRALVAPALGGDTIWSDAVAAYEDLDPRLQRRVDRLVAVHDYRSLLDLVESNEVKAALVRLHPPVQHPVVRIHPQTGERALYVNPTHTRRIVGMSADASDALLRELYQHMQRPEYQMRFKWGRNSIALWDNRSTQHYQVHDCTERRAMDLLTIAGDRPIGPA